MKRIALVVLAFVGPLILGACQERLVWEISVDIVSGNTDPIDYFDSIEYEEIMTLDQTNPLPQGGDCWGDYFFQFTAGNTVVRVYDLATKTLVQTVKLSGSQRGLSVHRVLHFKNIPGQRHKYALPA